METNGRRGMLGKHKGVRPAQTRSNPWCQPESGSEMDGTRTQGKSADETAMEEGEEERR